MKKISLDDIIEISIIKPDDLSTEKWEAYIFADTPMVDAADATDDDWELLPEYAQGYYYVAAESGGEDPKLVHYSHVMFRCWREPSLYSGWGFHNPEAGSGTDDCGGEPDYCFEGNGETVYLTGLGYVTQQNS